MKKAIGVDPFDIVYGIQARIHQNDLMNLYKFVQKYDEDITNDMQERMDELVGLSEHRRDATANNCKLQMQMKYLYDKKAIDRKFEPNDMVLMWNARLEDKGKHGKFDPIQLGPYLVDSKWGDDSYFLRKLSGGILKLPIYGKFLKRYFS